MKRALIAAYVLSVLVPIAALAEEVAGQLTDPQAKPVAGANVSLTSEVSGETWAATSDADGRFALSVSPGTYRLVASAPGLEDVTRTLTVKAGAALEYDLEFARLAARNEAVTVTADVTTADIENPDPAQRIFVRQQILDANPGRPGVPISLPGLPAETASGGIKAPQYFAPGVAGDHGEPITQYLKVGSYLVSDNLSANAHGNGYADPNFIVPATIESVQTDGGAFNVREGNHSVDLAATYGFHSRLEPFVTLTGDSRDIDLMAGWSPAAPGTRAWLAVQASYGNGFLDRLEHRQQYKINGFRVFDMGPHQVTVFGAGYYGESRIPGLAPLGVPGLHDTIDPRQRDQTHTGELAANDRWRLSPGSDLQLSGMFRTYNLALYSNFGDGLIRQSEFRTVSGASAIYIKKFDDAFSLMAGNDYFRDAPRRDDLDHYVSTDPAVYGPFEKVSANNITLGFETPFLAVDGSPTHWLHYSLGWRRDQIDFENQDLLNPTHSYQKWVGVNSPKATLNLFAPDHRFLPSVAFSFGQTFFTNDPRVGTGSTLGTPVSRAHAMQMVISQTILGTDFRVTLARVTQEASLAKIDADTGLQENEGPSRNRYISIAARRHYRYGVVQTSVSKADARDLSDGAPVAEAPRLIVDILGTIDRLPFHLRARAEFEEVGRKPLGDGFVSVPVREFRGALTRSFLNNRMDAGLTFLIASGYTGQTLEVLDDLEQVTGVRLPSYASLSWTYHFGR